jgi:hypothetical protein
MRILFIGGPGRSGTSFVADRLGSHPEVAALKDIELKIFCEKNGLLDLYHTLVETYSPNRAVVALDQFRRLTEALIDGRHGQAALATAAPAEEWRGTFAAFVEALSQDGHPVPQGADVFLAAARGLLTRIAGLAASAAGRGDDALFLEKTPHCLLAIGFLARLAPGAQFLHVMRDPRSIAFSLLAMPWGPDRLAGAARWVESYCRAWVAAETEAADRGLALTRLYIEEVATAPAQAAEWLTAQLGLAPRRELFRGASVGVLNRWAATAEPDERALLDRRLGGWAAHFGYDPGRFGHRPCPAIPGIARAAAPAAAPETLGG